MAVQRLEEIVHLLENEDVSLDDSVKLYKEGISLAQFCSEKLTTIESEVTILKKTGNGLFKKVPFIELTD